jgi:hypothetical protein
MALSQRDRTSRLLAKSRVANELTPSPAGVRYRGGGPLATMNIRHWQVLASQTYRAHLDRDAGISLAGASRTLLHRFRRRADSHCRRKGAVWSSNSHRFAYQLYLPKAWAQDAGRRDEAHVPEAIRFKTKPQIALAQIRAALAAGGGGGTNAALRASISALPLCYVTHPADRQIARRHRSE